MLLLTIRPLSFIYVDMERRERRKEAFQSKVLQKLYPAAPGSEKESSPPSIVGALSKKIYVKSKASQGDTATGDAVKTHSVANPGRRMYTVLPPPADYKIDSEKSVTLPLLESINSVEDPAGDSIHDSSEELDQDEEEEKQKIRRRRRKKKPTPHQEFGMDRAASVSATGTGGTPVDEGGEHISRNKKRKLKKKRRKEKLLSMGLMPQAAALEFTYKKDEEEEDEDDETKAAEVSDFLKTTMEMYMSDSSLRVDKLPLRSGTLDDLLNNISSRCKSTSVLKQLYSLKVFVQQKETDKLEKALKELHNTSSMSAEETAAVVSLFQYWITDILPMHGDAKT